MKACIYGAGAIGGWLGMALADAGCELSAVARGDTLRALRDGGLRLRGAEAERAVALRAEEDPAALGTQDLVVVAVKAPALAAVAARIGPLLGPETIVLTAMNGVPWWFLDGGFGGPLAGQRLDAVDPSGAIAQAIPSAHVIGGVVHGSFSLDGPGIVRHHFGNGLILGEPSGEASPRAQRLVDLLAAGGVASRLSTRIQRDVWYKLWGNMTVNPVSALTGATTDRILDDELVRGFISAIMLEARAIGAGIGLPIEETPEDRHAVTRRLGAFKTSMLQDVEAHRAIELDALVGAVRELGQRLDLPTPFTDALLGLTRLKGRLMGIYPD